RSPHHALDALTVGIERKKVNWVLDADIRDFFTSLDHGWLEKFLEHRIADKRVLRLISKWLNAGVIENGKWSETPEGAPQGASASPLLANVYLHYVFDWWASGGENATRTVMSSSCASRTYAERGINRLMPSTGLCRPGCPMPWSEEGWPFSGRHNPAVPAALRGCRGT